MKHPSLPIIGITLDSETPSPIYELEKCTGYSRYPWYALRDNYCKAISNAGGIPILLPHESLFLENYLEIIDGLLIPGGPYDIDPLLFGEVERHESVSINPGRTNFELALLKKALTLDLPVLGICGGHQLINVAFGGTLIQHIPHSLKSALAHKKLHHELAHSISIIPKTHLSDILADILCTSPSIEVNSVHHQAINHLGEGLVLSALTSDGIIEAIESLNHSFVMGVQWHPEFMLCAADLKIFEAFIHAAYKKMSPK